MAIFNFKTALYYIALQPCLLLGVGHAVLAQNYVDVDAYGGQQVTVNFDALDDGAADPYSTTPFSNPGFVLQEDVPMATLPRANRLSGTATQRLVLTPPPPRATAPLQIAAPNQSSDQLSDRLPAALPAQFAPQPQPMPTPIRQMAAAPMPQTVQPLGATTASKPLPPTTPPAMAPAPIFANMPAPSLPPRLANAPKAAVAVAPVAKAQPLLMPVAKLLPTPLPAPLPTPTLAQMPTLAPMVMPVAPINSQPIAPPPVAMLPTPATLMAQPSNKAIALAPQAAQSRQQAAAAAADTARLIFMVDSDALTAQSRQQLNNIGQLLAQETSTRVQLRAYAMGTQDTTSDARRLSLARGLTVRGQLLQLGAKPAQIDVRALGNAGGGIDAATGTRIPADRVDVIVLR